MEGNLRTEQTEPFHLTSRGRGFSQTRGRRSSRRGRLALCSIPSPTVFICPTYPSMLFSDAVNYCFFLSVGKKWWWSGDLEDTNAHGTDVWGGTEGQQHWSCSFIVGSLWGWRKGGKRCLAVWSYFEECLGFFSFDTASSQFSCTISWLQIFQLWLLQSLRQFLEADVLNFVAVFCFSG